MMFRTFLPGMEQRYAFAGSAVGAVMPLFIFSLETAIDGNVNPWLLPVKDATHVFMSLLPLVCGFLFWRIGRSRARLAAELEHAMQAERTLFFEARHDRLTGLANRVELETDIEDLMAARSAGLLRPAILLLDVDKFKFINDTLGHDAGDQLLIEISRRLMDTLGPFCRLFRLGGDEFVITVAGMPSQSDIERLCRSIVTVLSVPFDIKGSSVTSGASIGVTFMEADDDQMGQVLKRADLALYQAKGRAQGKFQFFSDELAEAAFARQKLERDLAGAVENNELFLEFQPIATVDTCAAMSFEALVRWRHPHLGVVYPDEFIREAERNGLILGIGRWVLDEACRSAARWPERYSVAVNVTPDQFKDRGFADYVLSTLAKYKLDPRRLTIEITESIYTVDSQILNESLQTLRVCGVRFALDDFGSGFSSIAHLKRFPVDTIKIDRSFTASMLDNRRDADLVDLIVRLSTVFNAETTVEGVETDDQLHYVRSIGAARVQGYLISRPLAASEVEAMIELGGQFETTKMLKASA